MDMSKVDTMPDDTFKLGDLVKAAAHIRLGEELGIGKIIGWNPSANMYWIEFPNDVTGWGKELMGNAIDLVRFEIECECGNKNNPIGQGHSHWCKRFRAEF